MKWAGVHLGSKDREVQAPLWRFSYCFLLKLISFVYLKAGVRTVCLKWILYSSVVSALSNQFFALRFCFVLFFLFFFLGHMHTSRMRLFLCMSKASLRLRYYGVRVALLFIIHSIFAVIWYLKKGHFHWMLLTPEQESTEYTRFWAFKTPENGVVATGLALAPGNRKRRQQWNTAEGDHAWTCT